MLSRANKFPALLLCIGLAACGGPIDENPGQERPDLTGRNLTDTDHPDSRAHQRRDPNNDEHPRSPANPSAQLVKHIVRQKRAAGFSPRGDTTAKERFTRVRTTAQAKACGSSC